MNKDKVNENPDRLTTDDEKVMNKDSLSVDDLKNAFSDPGFATTAEKPGTNLFGGGAVVIFSILMVAIGVLVAVVLSYTVIGLIVGIVMIMAGIAIPFLGMGRKS